MTNTSTNYVTTRLRAADVLVDIGAPAVGSLIDALRNGSTEVSRLAAEALARIGSPAVLPLIDILREWETGRWQLAVDALGRIEAPAVQPLIGLLSDRGIADLVVEALAKIGGPAVRPLINVLGHEDSLVSKLDLATLVKIGPSAIEGLIDVWNKSARDPSFDRSVHDLVGIAIWGINPQHVLLKRRPMAQRDFNPDYTELARILADARKLLNKQW